MDQKKQSHSFLVIALAFVAGGAVVLAGVLGLIVFGLILGQDPDRQAQVRADTEAGPGHMGAEEVIERREQKATAPPREPYPLFTEEHAKRLDDGPNPDLWFYREGGNGGSWWRVSGVARVNEQLNAMQELAGSNRRTLYISLGARTFECRYVRGIGSEINTGQAVTIEGRIAHRTYSDSGVIVHGKVYGGSNREKSAYDFMDCTIINVRSR